MRSFGLRHSPDEALKLATRADPLTIVTGGPKLTKEQVLALASRKRWWTKRYEVGLAEE